MFSARTVDSICPRYLSFSRFRCARRKKKQSAALLYRTVQYWSLDQSRLSIQFIPDTALCSRRNCLTVLYWHCNTRRTVYLIVYPSCGFQDMEKTKWTTCLSRRLRNRWMGKMFSSVRRRSVQPALGNSLRRCPALHTNVASFVTFNSSSVCATSSDHERGGSGGLRFI